MAFRKNKSLKQLIGKNTIRKNQNFLTPTQTTTAGQYTPCYTSRSLCYQQFFKTTTFRSTQTRETFTIFHQVTCHSNYVIYLLECIMCKIQYVGKSEKSFNITLNNHRKEIKKSNAIEACGHFSNNEHTFSKHGKFIIIELLRNTKLYPHRNTKIEIERKKVFGSTNFDTIRLKPRTELIPSYAVPAMLTLLSSFCIWTKNLTYISQLTSNNIILL